MEWSEILNYWLYVACVYLAAPTIGMGYFLTLQFIRDYKRD